VLAFEIQWEGLRNEELKRAFGAWLEILRPPKYGEPAPRPRSGKDSHSVPKAALSTALVDLGVMRLAHTLRPRQAEELSRKQAPERTDARKRVRENFRAIFHFIGKAELPRSDELWMSRCKSVPRGLAEGGKTSH